MNKITSVAAIVAAVALVAGVISVVGIQAAFASSHCHGDGSTCISFKNKAKANASGFGSTAANIQVNAIVTGLTG